MVNVHGANVEKWVVNNLMIGSSVGRRFNADSCRAVIVQGRPWVKADVDSSVEFRPSVAERELGMHQEWYEDSVQAIEAIDQEAGDEGVEVPTPIAKDNAKIVLAALSNYSKDLPAPVIYPTEDREVALDFFSSGSFVSVHCGPNGEAVCYSTIDGRRQRGRFDSADDLLERRELPRRSRHGARIRQPGIPNQVV